MTTNYNNRPVRAIKLESIAYKQLKKNIGKTLIGIGTLELIAQASFYLEGAPQNSGILGTIGVGLIAYGIKSYKNGSKLVDLIDNKYNN